MNVTEDMKRRAVDALDARRQAEGEPWFKLLANEVVEIVLAAALRQPERLGTYGGLPVIADESIPDGPPWIFTRQEPRRWMIRKAATLDDQPVDTPAASILGPNTEAVRVVEEAAYAELEEMYDKLLAAVPWREIAADLKTREG
jgi:hypothetical protein